MIINPYLVVPGVSYDPDAQAFITATSISGSDANAINELVLDLKGANIWTKFNALYPIIGTTATQQKFNLKNPADTNAAYRLTFAGGWTHSSNGALPNGTNAYADTSFITNLLTANSNHLGLYVRTNQVANAVPIGSYTNTPTNKLFQLNISTGTGTYYYSGDTTTEVTTSIADSKGFFVGTRTAINNRKIFRNGSSIASQTTSVSTDYNNISNFIGARNFNGTANSYTSQQIAFASIGSGLNDTESQLFYQIVEKYQVALGRNINPLQSFYYNRNYNNEANAYLFSTQIADTTQQVALNTLVSDMKTYGIWSKMKAVYPIMGTTATQQKFNLVNPQDTNAAYRLVFSGGWIHSSTGIKGNGSNTYADTCLAPSSAGILLYQGHLSTYCRTSAVTATAADYFLGTASNSGIWNNLEYFALATNPTSVSAVQHSSLNVTDYASKSVTNRQGFWLNSRTSSTATTLKLFRDGVAQANATTSAGGQALNIYSLYFGAIRNLTASSPYAQWFTSSEMSFASIGDGLTDTEAANFYTAVQNFQTSLGRSVGPQTVSDPDAQAFINAANIQDQVEATAINNLVIGLKADGLWTAMKAIYPMVGGSASANAVNLKTPGTYNLTFNGGWTHSTTGALPNGTNAYANTNFIANGNLSLYNSHQSYYSRTSGNPASTQIFMGNISNTGFTDLKAAWWLGYLNTGDARAIQHSQVSISDYANVTGQTSRAAFWMNNRTSSTSTTLKLWKNGSSVANATTTPGGESLNTSSTYLGARRNTTLSSPQAEFYTNAECAFASIGDGLTDTQAANLYTRVQAFNTELNRQV